MTVRILVRSHAGKLKLLVLVLLGIVVQRRVGLVRFAFVFAGLLIALAIISAVLEYFTGLNVNGAVIQIGAVVGAASDAGQRFYKTYQAVPDRDFATRASFQMTLVEFTISTTLAGLVLLYPFLQGEFAIGLGPLLFFLVPMMIVFYSVSYFAKRFVFVSGTKRAEKAHLKKLAENGTVFD